jgi:8-oxo-dGTP pyrophosphatase MutT (NUDIX family)
MHQSVRKFRAESVRPATTLVRTSSDVPAPAASTLIPVSERLNRPSARVVVVDDTGCVLLFRIVDPVDPKPPVWITPGGGVEPGETVVDAARRELQEETGKVVGSDELGAPVAVCRGEWEFRGVPFYSEDVFFGLRVPRFEPTEKGLTELEREVHHSWRWWSPEEIDAADEVVLPSGVADVVRQVGQGKRAAEPVELPWTAV